jgi:hypothetical protein
MASRCACIMRGINTPFDVDLTSSNAEVAGIVVPIPVFPVAGNMFCAERLSSAKSKANNTHAMRRLGFSSFSIKSFFLVILLMR